MSEQHMLYCSEPSVGFRTLQLSPRCPGEKIEACRCPLLLPAVANCLCKRQDSLGSPFGREEGTTLTDTGHLGACARYEARASVQE